ncbi:type II secretion system protein [Natronospora cellulosivora (SeqCode)]
MKMFSRNLRSENGFTLIELLVVIAVLGVLATIAVPRLTGLRDRAVEAEAVSALGSLRSALEIYQLEDTNGNYPTTPAIFNSRVADRYLDGYDLTNTTWEGWTITFDQDPTTFTGVDGADINGTVANNDVFGIEMETGTAPNILRVYLLRDEDAAGDMEYRIHP